MKEIPQNPDIAPRVRFAPSPTGFLHVGSLRTALYNYLFAKKYGGTYLLRIEDTDQKRFVPGAKEHLIHALFEMGLNADEGFCIENNEVTERGEHGPYEQSKRLELYQEHAQKLITEGKAYYCFCTAERLEQVRNEMAAKKLPPKYDKHCLALSSEEVQKKLSEDIPHVIRLNVVPGEDITFTDLVRGEITINTSQVDDQVLIKSDGFPTYHLAVVVDDHLMNITHVLRSEEWLPSTPKHILLFQAFGWQVPHIGHVSFILGPDGKKKLSKRDGGASVEDFLRQGYLQEALLNFLVLLGWNKGDGSTQEIFSLQELEAVFDVRGLHKGGAAFDRKKLDWMNSEYIKKLSLDDLYQKMVEGEFFDREHIKGAPQEMQTPEYLKKVLTIEQERLPNLGSFGVDNPFFFASDITYDTNILPWKQNSLADTKEALQRALQLLEGTPLEVWSNKDVLQSVLLEEAGDKKGDFLWPLRVALTGKEKTPGPAEVAWVLGKEESLKRLNKAINLL